MDGPGAVSSAKRETAPCISLRAGPEGAFGSPMDADHVSLGDVNNDRVDSERPLVLRRRNIYNRLTNSEATGRVQIVPAGVLGVLLRAT
jgi:hypothetical protein